MHSIKKVIISSAIIVGSFSASHSFAMDPSMVRAHEMIIDQLFDAHDQYRKTHSDYDAGYIKGLEQAQTILTMASKGSVDRQAMKAELRKALIARNKVNSSESATTCQANAFSSCGIKKEKDDPEAIAAAMHQQQAEMQAIFDAYQRQSND